MILTWTAPTAPNDCPVTGYSVGIGYEPGTSDASETETPHTTTELIMGRGTYHARVQAIAGTQRSPYSADVTLTIDDPEPACLSRPQAPQTPTMTSDGGRVNLAWVPASGCPALGYLVLIGSSPGAQDRLSLIAYTPAATVLLATGTAHAVVAGFNQEGIGAFSEPLTITTTARTPNPDPEPPPICAPTRIPPPRNLRASVSALVATITWDAPIGDCLIGSYQVTGGVTPRAFQVTA